MKYPHSIFNTLTLFIILSFFKSLHAQGGLPIRLGFIAGLTSPDLFEEANRSLQMFQMLIDDENKKHPHRPIEVVTFDTKGNSSHAYSLIERIKASHLTALLGFYTSNDALPLAWQLDRENIPTVVVSAASPLILKDTHFLVQVSCNSEREGIDLAKKTFSMGKKKLLSVFDITDSSAVVETAAFTKEFIKLGGIIVDSLSIDMETISFKKVAAAIAGHSQEIDGIKISARTIPAFYLWTQMIDARVNTDIIASGSILFQNLSTIVKDYAPYFNIKLFPVYWDPKRRDYPQARSIFKTFEQRYHSTISDYDVDPILTHDATRLLLKSIEQTKKLTPLELLKTIKETHITGLSETISFDSHGYSKTPVVMFQLKQGKLYHAD